MTPKKLHPADPGFKRADPEFLSEATQTINREVAQRDPIQERYDILDPDFIRFMALIADYGARKYGESNWKKSRLTDSKSPVNHIYKHLIAYQQHEPYDHLEIGNERYIHLAAIAFNAMMEFYYEFKEFVEPPER